MRNSEYIVKTIPVFGGFDLTITYEEQTATLFIQDKAQVNELSQRIIELSQQQSIGINAAFSIFNRGMGMFSGETKS